MKTLKASTAAALLLLSFSAQSSEQIGHCISVAKYGLNSDDAITFLTSKAIDIKATRKGFSDYNQYIAGVMSVKGTDKAQIEMMEELTKCIIAFPELIKYR